MAKLLLSDEMCNFFRKNMPICAFVVLIDAKKAVVFTAFERILQPRLSFFIILTSRFEDKMLILPLPKAGRAKQKVK